MRTMRLIASATLLTCLATAPAVASPAGSTGHLAVTVTVVRSVAFPGRAADSVAERGGRQPASRPPADVPAVFAGGSGTLRRVECGDGCAAGDVLTAIPDGAPPSLVIEEAALD